LTNYDIPSQFAATASYALLRNGYLGEATPSEGNISRLGGQTIGYQGGCRFTVQINDTTYPHFILIVRGKEIAFDIETGQRLGEKGSFPELNDFVRVYWRLDRWAIRNLWNSLRPDDSFDVPEDWSQDQSDTAEVIQGIEEIFSASLSTN
jgi:hypothetical protein